MKGLRFSRSLNEAFPNTPEAAQWWFPQQPKRSNKPTLIIGGFFVAFWTATFFFAR